MELYETEAHPLVGWAVMVMVMAMAMAMALLGGKYEVMVTAALVNPCLQSGYACVSCFAQQWKDVI